MSQSPVDAFYYDTNDMQIDDGAPESRRRFAAVFILSFGRPPHPIRIRQMGHRIL
jgi:hypothetical protein